MIAQQRLRCTQRAVSLVHDIARLVKTGLGGGLHWPIAYSLYTSIVYPRNRLYFSVGSFKCISLSLYIASCYY